MLWALTSPVPEARTDLGAILPLIVATTFIFVGNEYAVGVSVAWLGVVRITRAEMVTVATKIRFIT
jgi:hypothetical protein